MLHNVKSCFKPRVSLVGWQFLRYMILCDFAFHYAGEVGGIDGGAADHIFRF